MTFAFSNQFIHKQLIIGCHQQGPIGAGNNAIQGCIGAHGVVNIGGEGFSYGEATLMVETSTKQTGDRALKVKGCAAILPAGGSVSLINSAGQTVEVENPSNYNVRAGYKNKNFGFNVNVGTGGYGAGMNFDKQF